MVIMGHSSVDMHRWYDTVQEVDLPDAVEKLGSTIVLLEECNDRTRSHKTPI
jgi:hypothetical protein